MCSQGFRRHARRVGEPVVIDLADIGSGGNSIVARAIMGWFTYRPRPYQVHASPESGVPPASPDNGPNTCCLARESIILARCGCFFGRWAGSMGKGLAIGFDALGVPVCGAPMAGLLGVIEDNRFAKSGMVARFATERLTNMSWVASEAFVPRRLDDRACGIGMWAPS